MAPPPHITDLISQPGHPGQPGVFTFPVLLLKVAKINFRKSQVESARVVFQNFECRQFLKWGGHNAPPPHQVGLKLAGELLIRVPGLRISMP